MRAPALLLVTIGLAACASPPGQADYDRAWALLASGDGGSRYSELYASTTPGAADSLRRIHQHLDAAAEAGHGGAAMLASAFVISTEGLLAAEPTHRRLAALPDDERGTNRIGWEMLALTARGRPQLEAGLPADSVDWRDYARTDIEAEVAVLREGASGDVPRLDSMRAEVLAELRNDSGHPAADSILARLGS